VSQSSDRPSPTVPPKGNPRKTNTGPVSRPLNTPPPNSPTYRGRSSAPTYRARPITGSHPVLRPDLQSQRALSRYRGDARKRRVRVAVFGALAVLAVAFIAIYVYVSHTVDTISNALNTVFRPTVVAHVGADGTPVPVVYPEWGTQPVNILLLGLDYRPATDTSEADTRADTQIIVHIDPVAKSAAMVAIPRDLWVPIPDFPDGRINSAYQLGETNKARIEGGGPVLAMSTIEQNFGIQIQYYAKVDFTGFEQILDTIGGVTIDVPRPLVDNEYPLGNYGVTRLYIPAGLQHMDGRTALAYARSRHADSDLGRNSRQEQVLLAVRQQGLNLNLITKLNDLAGELSTAVETNLSISQVGSLYQLSKDIDKSSIQSVTISADMVTETFVGGADVLLPNWDLIRPAVAQAFANPGLSKEAARLSVQNGTETGGAGKKIRDELVAKGFFVPDLRSTSDPGTHPLTEITDFTNGQKPLTLKALCHALSFDCTKVKQGLPADAPISETDNKPVDIMVVVGDDKIN
jgi:LCP family protein required for cell wall assembly